VAGQASACYSIPGGLHILNAYWLYSTLLPKPWATTGTAAGAASQAFHLPEDLSGLPSLRDPHNGGWDGTGVPLLTDKVIAKQLATAVFRSDGYRSHLLGRLFQRAIPAVGGLGASSAVAFPFRACQLMYSGRRI
jgi:hypothetical protein